MAKHEEDKEAKKEAKRAAKKAKKEEKKERKRAEKEARKRERETKKQEKRASREEEDRSQEDTDEDSLTKQLVEEGYQTPPRKVARKIRHVPLVDASSQTAEAGQDGPFYKKWIEVSASVMPADMGDIKTALEDNVRNMILQYIPNLGIMLTFHNLKVIANDGAGMILDELPFITYKVGFDSCVFDPKIGNKLQGTISNSFQSHLAILVIGNVNAMIPAQSMQLAGYKFDVDAMEWSKDDGSDTLVKDQKMEFYVDKIHAHMGILSIEGSKLTQFVEPPAVAGSNSDD
ncbi:Pfam:RNA_pol_Rpb7_N [Seminavis robusta]|uniref:Pfam:RNA_pol_Rpb7_N n=1 Tax=Seminavis robusta TaxID=568900 RepID=A0A9N8HEQ5_9STRA|nr:Pfam:RNA_pol_Rpb7_N [Seminavis robusta]|eukprot:Sro420_g139300.1 Pfam:RNA_pol_Rpb7_N (288) ;mRNA; f:31959-32946